MAISLAALSGTVADLVGDVVLDDNTNNPNRRVKVVVDSNAPGDYIADLDNNVMRLGTATVTPAADGTWSFADLIATGSADTNLDDSANLQYTVTIDYPRASDRQRIRESFGPFALEASSDITDLVAGQTLTVTYQSAFMTQAQALLDAQIALSGIDDTDSAVAGLIEDDLVGPLTNAALSAAYVRPSVVAPAPSGSAATDTAALQAAINSVADGGRLYLPTHDEPWLLNDSLTITSSLTIEGDSVTPRWSPVSTVGEAIMPVDPYLSGSVLKMTTAAKDVLKITGSGVTVNLRKIGILFADGLASTGHGVNATPSLVVGAGHDLGVQGFTWENVYVYGHDGNHYGFVMLNPQLGTVVQCHAYGGGGFYTSADAGTINAGNVVFIHPFNALVNAGTAGGFVHSGGTGTPGTLNLLTYIRPQCIVGGAATAAGTNPMWKDDAGAGTPKGMNVFGANFETGGTNDIIQGAQTTFIANAVINNANLTNTVYGKDAFPAAMSSDAIGTAFGSAALGSVTTGSYNVAVGGNALTALTTGTGNTGIGNNAAQSSTTGGNNVAVGRQALAANTTGGNNTAVGTSALLVATATGNTAIGYQAMVASTTGTNAVALGTNSLQRQTTGANSSALGYGAGAYITTGNNNTMVGQLAGVTNTSANATTTGNQNVHIGSFAGNGAADGNLSNNVAVGYNASVQGSTSTAIGASANTGAANATALGAGVAATASGSVAIGRDSSNGAASATISNSIALGTANHKLQLKNNTTGAGSAALGANCPAVTATAPYTWFTMLSSDGSTVYVPAWK